MSKEPGSHGYIHLVEAFSESQRKIMSAIGGTAFPQIASAVSSHRSIEDMLPGIDTAVKQMAVSLAATNASRLQLEPSVLSGMFEPMLKNFALIEKSAATDMLMQFREGLLGAQYELCFDAITRTLSNNIIEAANMAFLKTSNILLWDSPLSSIATGVRSVLPDFTMYSASRLSKNVDISFNFTTRRFFDEKKPENDSTISEMNHICATADMLETTTEERIDIEETELINFMSFLSDTPTRGSTHPVGQMIDHIVDTWNHMVGFEQDRYYHARARKADQAPYPQNEMLIAPAGITNAGRYNFTGQAFYYFADTVDGAKSEVKKHCGKDALIQIAEMKPYKPINMLDLSGEWKNRRFLKYLRFSVSDFNQRMPREYLIPCFISDCCRIRHIEGIKYSGSKEYNNYVCWNTGFFDFVRTAYDGI